MCLSTPLFVSRSRDRCSLPLARPRLLRGRLWKEGKTMKTQQIKVFFDFLLCWFHLYKSSNVKRGAVKALIEGSTVRTSESKTTK